MVTLFEIKILIKPVLIQCHSGYHNRVCIIGLSCCRCRGIGEVNVTMRAILSKVV